MLHENKSPSIVVPQLEGMTQETWHGSKSLTYVLVKQP